MHVSNMCLLRLNAGLSELWRVRIRQGVHDDTGGPGTTAAVCCLLTPARNPEPARSRFPELAQIYAARGCQVLIYPGEWGLTVRGVGTWSWHARRVGTFGAWARRT